MIKYNFSIIIYLKNKTDSWSSDSPDWLKPEETSDIESLDSNVK